MTTNDDGRLTWSHPPRPRCSQSGREKRRDKSFQVEQKSPWVPTLTELFPKIQADAGSWLGTKNALYCCAQSANSFSWVLFVSSYTTYTPFVHQACASKGNFYFLLSWPETKELLMSRKNVWNAISRSNSICPENILFLTHHNVS